MISFRFHLVSLVAVFLALGIGVVAGTTVLNQRVVETLEGNAADLERDLKQVRDQNRQLTEDLSTFQSTIVPFTIAGRLAGQDAVVVTQEGTDDRAIELVVAGLQEAGAEVLALLSVGPRMALPEEADREDLAATIDAQGISDPVELKRMAAEALAARLSIGPLDDDILPDLIRQEFLLNEGPGLGEQGLEQLAEADAVVVVGGGVEQPALLPQRFLVPLVASLAENDDAQVVGAAESLNSSYDFVTLLRSDQQIASSLVTQDNVDQLVGEVGLVLGLEQLLVLGEPGHYGQKDGATGPIPPPTST